MATVRRKFNLTVDSKRVPTRTGYLYGPWTFQLTEQLQLPVFELPVSSSAPMGHHLGQVQFGMPRVPVLMPIMAVKTPLEHEPSTKTVARTCQCRRACSVVVV